MNKPFVDIILEENDGYSICYRSEQMVYEESLIGGMYVSSGWYASGYPFATNPLPKPPRLDSERYPLPQAFQFELDGASLGYEWEWGGLEKVDSDKGLLGTVTLKNKLIEVTVKINTLLDGTRAFSRWLEISNNTGRALNLSRLAVISGGLQTIRGWKDYTDIADQLYRLGYMEHSQWGMEGSFAWHDLPNAGYNIAGRFRKGRHRHPMFILENRATGESFISQFGWSGGYSFDFELDAERGASDAHLSFAIRIDAPAPLRIIEPGETITTPEVHVGVTFGGLDEAVNQMHDHLRKSVFLPPARGKRCWIESGIGPESCMSRDATLETIEKAAAVGCEIFFIDAGWYLPPDQESKWWEKVGDWQYDQDRYPNGLSDIRDAVKAKGMLFGLWMDAERIGKASQAYHEHQDYISIMYNDCENGSQMINLANPEAAAWMEQQISRVIEENQCDFFRLDYNTWNNATRTNRNGILENDYMRYYEALYAIYKRLRQKYPDVVFENCAGGGGRTDVGMTRYFDHTWVTDWQIAPRSFAITNGMTMALPPEHVDRLVTGQTGYLNGSLDFQLRLLLFVRPTGQVNAPLGERLNDIHLEFFKHCFGLYKDFIRPFLPESKVYHHTPTITDIQPKGFGILETAAKDGTRGILGVFQLSSPKERETVVRLKGADVSKEYEVTFDNARRTCKVSGYALVNEGIRIWLEGALTSELVLYKAM